MFLTKGYSFDDVVLRPGFFTLDSREYCDTTTRLSSHIELRVPIISASMDTITETDMAIAMANCGGLGIIHRFQSIDRQVNMVKEVLDKSLLVGASIGIKDCEKNRACSLIEAGCKIISVDVAHAHQKICGHMIKWLRDIPDISIIAGNVATGPGAAYLAEAGADVVKCGIGPGSVCTTRLMTGAGVPQLSAIDECNRSLVELRYLEKPFYNHRKVTLIADGGIRTPGDIVKALAAGANAVMIGNLLSACNETPGPRRYIAGNAYKHYTGMSRGESTEGVDLKVKCTGENVSDIINRLEAGIRSGMSYCGACNLHELRIQARFITVTPSGYEEGTPHFGR